MPEQESNKAIELQRAVNELSVLNEIANAINISMSTEKIAETIVQHCIKHIAASQGAIFLIDELSKTSDEFKTFIRSRSTSTIEVSFHLNQFIIGWMIKNKTILLCNDLKSDQRFGLADFEKQGIKSILAIPLVDKKSLIGIMSIFNKEADHGFDENDRRFLSIVGSQVAKVLENARLFERENKFLTELNQLRLQNMAKLAAGIAHEFNSPVGAIVSSANLVKRAIGNLKRIFEQNKDILSGGEVEKNFNSLVGSADVIETGGENVKNLVNRLKSFVQLDQGELQRIDIHKCIEDCLVMLNFRLEKRIIVSRRFDAESELNCFPAQLNQVFYEILLNSIEAIPEKGLIEITTYDKEDYFYATIKDSGKGIPEQDIDQVFEPGFTTKGAKVGVGLGLPICFQIIKSHHGDLTVNSEPGKGTTVIIKLPLDVSESLN